MFKLEEGNEYPPDHGLVDMLSYRLRGKLFERDYYHFVAIRGISVDVMGKVRIRLTTLARREEVCWVYESPCSFLRVCSALQETHDFPDEFYTQLVDALIVHYTTARLGGA
jgi:hypothetical protein